MAKKTSNFYLYSEFDYSMNIVEQSDLRKARKACENWPDIVKGNFNCSDGLLTSLKGAPTEVIKHFNCSGNQLINLDFSPTKVGRNFYCHNNPIKTLSGFGKRFLKEGFINGELYIPLTLEEGLLSVLLIPHLEKIIIAENDSAGQCRQTFQHGTPFGKAVDCINAYLQENPIDIMECQEELIDAGLAKFAKL